MQLLPQTTSQGSRPQRTAVSSSPWTRQSGMYVALVEAVQRRHVARSAGGKKSTSVLTKVLTASTVAPVTIVQPCDWRWAVARSDDSIHQAEMLDYPPSFLLLLSMKNHGKRAQKKKKKKKKKKTAHPKRACIPVTATIRNSKSTSSADWPKRVCEKATAAIPVRCIASTCRVKCPT